MKFSELIPIIFGKTDIDFVKKGHIIKNIKHDRLNETPNDIKDSEIDYISAVDGRTIEIGLKENENEKEFINKTDFYKS